MARRYWLFSSFSLILAHTTEACPVLVLLGHKQDIFGTVSVDGSVSRIQLG